MIFHVQSAATVCRKKVWSGRPHCLEIRKKHIIIAAWTLYCFNISFIIKEIITFSELFNPITCKVYRPQIYIGRFSLCNNYRIRYLENAESHCYYIHRPRWLAQFYLNIKYGYIFVINIFFLQIENCCSMVVQGYLSEIN